MESTTQTAGKPSPKAKPPTRRGNVHIPTARSASALPKDPPSALEIWRPAAMARPHGRLDTRVPLRVLLDEAVDLARFVQTRFATVRGEDGGVVRVGLDSVAGAGRRVSAASGEEILSLREAVQAAQSRYVLARQTHDGSAAARGRAVLGEIRAALTYLFDDGVEDARRARLEKVALANRGSRARTALAADLQQFAALGERHRGELDGLGGFDARLLDEARELSARLLSRPASQVALEDEAKSAKELRNRLIALLSDRMATIRAAARFVFRRAPDVVREATSPYERRRRAASRRTVQAVATRRAAEEAASHRATEEATSRRAAEEAATRTAEEAATRTAEEAATRTAKEAATRAAEEVPTRRTAAEAASRRAAAEAASRRTAHDKATAPAPRPRPDDAAEKTPTPAKADSPAPSGGTPKPKGVASRARKDVPRERPRDHGQSRKG